MLLISYSYAIAIGVTNAADLLIHSLIPSPINQLYQSNLNHYITKLHMKLQSSH